MSLYPGLSGGGAECIYHQEPDPDNVIGYREENDFKELVHAIIQASGSTIYRVNPHPRDPRRVDVAIGQVQRLSAVEFPSDQVRSVFSSIQAFN
jgi:hypothetical protein